MLSPRKVNQSRNSPKKQNISPARRGTPLGINQNAVIDKIDGKLVTYQLLVSMVHELQSLVVRMGGKVPNHLTLDLYTPPQQSQTSKISLIPSLQSHQTQAHSATAQQINSLNLELNNLKVKISNYQFELKKRQQDEAQYKVLTKIDRDKQVKKLKTEIGRLEAQILEDNSKWQAKFEELKLDYSTRLTSNIEKKQSECKQQISKLIQSHQQKIQALTKNHQSQIQSLTNTLTSQSQTLTVQHTQAIQKVNQQHKNQLQNVRIKHIEQIQKLQKKQQQIQLAHESQKKVEKKKTQEQTIKANKAKQKLYNQLYLVRKEKQELGNLITGLRAEILGLQKSIKEGKMDLQNVKAHHSLQIKALQSSHAQAINLLGKTHKQALVQLHKSHQKNINTLEKSLNSLKDLTKNRQQIFIQTQLQLESKFENRPSRLQDLSQIQKLGYEMMCKDQEIAGLRAEVKQVRMEKDNNQRNYNRIFASQGPVRQKLTERPMTATCSREKDRQKDRDIIRFKQSQKMLFKKGNTIDISFILKACNKNF